MTLHFPLSALPSLPKEELSMGGKNPQGIELAVNSRCWEKNGEPVFPNHGGNALFPCSFAKLGNRTVQDEGPGDTSGFFLSHLAAS